ncbi:MAG: hypothetical protein KDH09_16870 [Chrysiogenetes bacterium]|nr:hypothetical protein [Chrysiogenetes bacterium]
MGASGGLRHFDSGNPPAVQSTLAIVSVLVLVNVLDSCTSTFTSTFTTARALGSAAAAAGGIHDG